LRLRFLDRRSDCRLEEPLADSGGANVERDFSSDFEGGMEREGINMTVDHEDVSPDPDNSNSLLLTLPPSRGPTMRT
jgi:hypothetical protein